MAHILTTFQSVIASCCSQKKEIRRLAEDTKTPGLTIVPTLVFIDNNGRAKVDIALARGKKEYDKRQSLKEKEDPGKWIGR